MASEAETRPERAKRTSTSSVAGRMLIVLGPARRIVDARGKLQRISVFSTCWSGDHPGLAARPGLGRDSVTDTHCGDDGLLLVQEKLSRELHADNLYVFRRRRGDLINCLRGKALARLATAELGRMFHSTSL